MASDEKYKKKANKMAEEGSQQHRKVIIEGGEEGELAFHRRPKIK